MFFSSFLPGNIFGRTAPTRVLLGHWAWHLTKVYATTGRIPAGEVNHLIFPYPDSKNLRVSGQIPTDYKKALHQRLTIP